MAILSDAWENTLKKEKEGLKFVENYCKKYKLDFRISEPEENFYYGIDCYIDGVPTDVKHTHKIYFGKLNQKTGKFIPRHPFRKETKAKNYFIVVENEVKYHGPILAYLDRFFKNVEAIDGFVEYLNKHNSDYAQPINSLKYAKQNLLDFYLKNSHSMYVGYENFWVLPPNSEISIWFETREDYEKYTPEAYKFSNR